MLIFLDFVNHFYYFFTFFKYVSVLDIKQEESKTRIRKILIQIFKMLK
jgi:hypothetical protein